MSSDIVQRVMCCLVDRLSAEFLKQLREVDSFSFNGIVYVSLCIITYSHDCPTSFQAYIELSSLEEVMEVYLSEESISTFELCRLYLSEWDVQADEK